MVCIVVVRIRKFLEFFDIYKSKYVMKGGVNMAGKRKYTCNYDYFSKIDTPDKAYWLGMLMADGCVMHTRRLRHLKTCDSWQDRFYLQLSLKEDDIGHIQKFIKAIGSNHPINIYEYSGKQYNNDGKYGRLIIEDRHLVEDLIALGVCEKKTLILKYPNIPPELDSHFIRGYFDGDGCISMSQVGNESPMYEANITSTYEFLKEVYKRLPLNSDKEFKPKQRYPERNNNNWTFRFGGNRQLLRVLNYLYKDSTDDVRLDRKYQKYKELKNLMVVLHGNIQDYESVNRIAYGCEVQTLLTVNG